MGRGLLVIIMLLLVGLFVVGHELVHASIFRNYGQDYRFGMTWVGVYTDGSCPVNSDCELAHSINEVVGYTVCPFLLFIIFLLLKRSEVD